MAWTTCHDHDVDFDDDDGCPVCLVKAELTVANSEIARLRADLANAGAVMVEACAQAALPDGFEPECCRDIRIALAAKLRALSTLSPIAAAAGLVADAIDADMRTFNQCLGEEPATGETKAGHFFAQILRRYSSALAEQEKAE